VRGAPPLTARNRGGFNNPVDRWRVQIWQSKQYLPHLSLRPLANASVHNPDVVKEQQFATPQPDTLFDIFEIDAEFPNQRTETTFCSETSSGHASALT
jgi:hypothetical protein